jgi:quinol monooxygenase YgiN
MNDLILLKRYSESSYLSNGLYMIESISTGGWLTDSKDDLCIMSKKVHRECIFSIKQIDTEECCLEYVLHNEQTQRRLTVLTSDEDEERWISSSILSTHRNESFRACSTFIFEKIDDQNQFHIRPCYLHAKRLQVSEKRVIVSLCENENTLNHRFRLHRIS